MSTQTTQETDEKSLQERLEQLNLEDRAEEFLDDILDELESQKSAANDAYKMAVENGKKLREKQSQIDDLEKENERLRDRVDELDERTQLLSNMAQSDDISIVSKRAGIVLQTLYAKAKTNKEKSNSKATAKEAADYNRVNDFLRTELSRTQCYEVMRRATEIVEQEDAVSFIKETKSSEKNTRLQLDLEGVDELSTTPDSGVEITPNGGNAR